ncbi:hypothetical protein IX88_14265 [Acinetobacter baumannii]|uniref:hypothetical protein n=1 Tax=Acinetobacter baumannii TaxID=470 RepID=UPI0004F60E21|nr:hypothetical protein [Acinetobacter baumannii]AIL76314.1 hypothetical protein IX88_14265 [Acinetobacter baumannii]KAB1100106.1 hypothetical protein F6W73_11845 [Acinetobacter baumannii]MCA4179807.1 hypothetical protein [Acinetobacter baumannii]MCV4241868.1 hypothetical protein [Acinetobacter baumannii]MDA4860820.1 hypothetical protein [Acinetobacter baumannii]
MSENEFLLNVAVRLCRNDESVKNSYIFVNPEKILELPIRGNKNIGLIGNHLFTKNPKRQGLKLNFLWFWHMKILGKPFYVLPFVMEA